MTYSGLLVAHTRSASTGTHARTSKFVKGMYIKKGHAHSGEARRSAHATHPSWRPRGSCPEAHRKWPSPLGVLRTRAGSRPSRKQRQKNIKIFLKTNKNDKKKGSVKRPVQRRRPRPTLPRPPCSGRLPRAAAHAQPRLQTPGAARTAGPSGAYSSQVPLPEVPRDRGISRGAWRNLQAPGGQLRNPFSAPQAGPEEWGWGEEDAPLGDLRTQGAHQNLSFDWL